MSEKSAMFFDTITIRHARNIIAHEAHQLALKIRP
ncbi:MAG: hypothetical protein RIQ68_845, partial [Pseudomonadota bacterium]